MPLPDKIRSKKTLGREFRVAATEAAKNFGRLVDRVREEGATYIIERNGKPVAQIGPVETTRHATIGDFKEMLRAMPKLDEEVLRYIEEGVAMFNRPEVPKNPWER